MRESGEISVGVLRRVENDIQGDNSGSWKMDFKAGGALDVGHVHIRWLYNGYVYACEQADEKVFITVMHNARADGDGLFSWLSNAHGVCMASPAVLSPIKCASWDEDRPTKKGIEVWYSKLEKRFGTGGSGPELTHLELV